MTKVKVEFTPGSETEQVVGYIASFPDWEYAKGMVVTGNTKAEAFNELMTSLKVKIAFDNDIIL